VAAEEFTVTVDESGPEQTIVRVDGELDLGTAPKLADELELPTASGKRVVLDLTGCEFIDSSGLRTLLSARSAASDGGGSFALVVSDPNLLRVFEVASLDRVLEIHSTVDAALVA
jgi:anti-sigma B factor antagonist